MSCLSERERAALEDIFLSISVNESPYERCKNSYAFLTPLLKGKVKTFSALLKSRRHLPSYAQAKHFLRQKREKLGHKMGFLRHR
jgi:hypothetical protein